MYFTGWLKVKRRRNSSNLIGGEQKFVPWAFTQEAGAQRRTPSKMLTWQHFLRVLEPRVSTLDQKFGQEKNGNPNYGQEEELWLQEFLLLGSLGNNLLFGRPPCEAALTHDEMKQKMYSIL
jgi:hypothetical protein